MRWISSPMSSLSPPSLGLGSGCGSGVARSAPVSSPGRRTAAVFDEHVDGLRDRGEDRALQGLLVGLGGRGAGRCRALPRRGRRRRRGSGVLPAPGGRRRASEPAALPRAVKEPAPRSASAPPVSAVAPPRVWPTAKGGSPRPCVFPRSISRGPARACWPASPAVAALSAAAPSPAAAAARPHAARGPRG